MLNALLKAVMEADRSPVVICDLAHTIVYMNPAAKLRYAKDGGGALVGRSVLDCHPPQANEMIFRVINWFAESREHNMIHTFYNKRENKDVYMVALRDEAGTLIGYYEKHEHRNPEEAPLYDFSKSII